MRTVLIIQTNEGSAKSRNVGRGDGQRFLQSKGRRELSWCQRATNTALFIGSLIALSTGCGDVAPSGGHTEVPSPANAEESVEALGEGGCTSALADATIEGFGEAQTGSSYGSSSCNDAYVVDINSYAPADSGGSVVTYSGENAADKQICESTVLELYVWRRNHETNRYEPIKTQDGKANLELRGHVYQSTEGETLCQRPRVVLDEEYPLFLPGGDFRVGFRAERKVGSETRLAEAALVTPLPPRTPTSILGNARRLQRQGELADLATQLLQLPPDERAATCRADQLELDLLGMFKPTLMQIGAQESTVNNYLLNRDKVRELYCQGDPAASGSFQASLPTWGHDAAAALETMVGQIGQEMGLDSELAMGLMVRTLNDVVNHRMAQCNADKDALGQFLLQGTMPSGGLEAALFGGCGGSAGDGRIPGASGLNAYQLANDLASGKGVQGSFRRCVSDALEKELEDDACNDPVAEGKGVESDVLDQCMKHSSEDQQDACFEEAKRRWQQQQGGGEPPKDGPSKQPGHGGSSKPEGCAPSERLPCGLALDALNSPDQLSAKQIREAREGNSFGSKYWSAGLGGLVSTIADGIKGFVGGLLDLPHSIFVAEGQEAAEIGLTAVHERNLRDYCPWHPGHEKCEGLDELKKDGGGNRRCIGEQFGSHTASYLTSNGVDMSVNEAGETMTMFDRLDACYCDFMGGPLFGQDCLSPEERKRQECAAPPPGPDDGPDPQCAQYMHSDTLDPSLMDAAICKYVRPDPDCVSVIGPDGQCLCADQLPRGDLQGQIDQKICGEVYCDPLGSSAAENAIFDVRTGCCQEIPNQPLPTPGQRPCPLPPVTQLPWESFDIDALVPARIRDVRDLTNSITRNAGLERDLNFYRAGYTSAIGPVIQRESFPVLQQLDSSDDRVMLDVEALRAVDASCNNDRIQAFCTSDALENRLLGEVSLAQLEPGAFGEVQIPVRAELADACLPNGGSGSRISFAVDSCANSETRTALGEFTFTRPDLGWIESDLAPVCPEPGGDRTVYQLNVSPTTTAEITVED